MKHEKLTIRTNQDAKSAFDLFFSHKPEVGAMDTETTGLHIVLDKPFLFQFGWIKDDTIYSFAIDIERRPQLSYQVIKAWNHAAKSLKLYLGHHIVFDLHMLHNIGLPYEYENMSDTMFYIRFAHDAVAERKGGPPLGLKPYCARYIDRAAAHHERLLEQEKSALAKSYNLMLKDRTGWNLGKLEEFFKDPVRDYADLPEAQQQAYLKWYNEDLPEQIRYRVEGKVEADDIPYNMLNRTNIIEYAHGDIYLALMVWFKLNPVVIARGTMEQLQNENKLLLPFCDMERVGFKTNVEYLEASRSRMKEYIAQRRAVLYSLAQQPLKIGQHALIKDLLQKIWGVEVTTTNEEELTRLEPKLRQTIPEAAEFISVLQELRTLEKWYSTYIQRFLRNLRETDRLYTSINQVGTVSLRVTSDFQQFPREGIKTSTGEELFMPRKMVIPSGGDYPGLVYIDYSQVELRLQGIYTILVGHPEEHLLLAYEPYGHIAPDGHTFDPMNPEDVINWRGTWLDAEGKQWKPADVHARSTCFIFDITPQDPKFKALRSSHGKPYNFMKNYGGGWSATRRMFPEKSEEEISKIDKAYYLAFPNVLYYHQYCQILAATESHAVNLFGAKFYNVSGHDLINLLIQSSGASLLKWKIRQIWEWSKANKIKSRFQMNIHDELSWERHKDDSFEVFKEIQTKMEDWRDALVPIVAEMSYSTTTWADKKELKGDERFE